MRLLVDAGPDTTWAVHLTDPPGGLVVLTTTSPLEFTTFELDQTTLLGKPATQEQLQWLEATRRLLFQVEAVQAALGCCGRG